MKLLLTSPYKLPTFVVGVAKFLKFIIPPVSLNKLRVTAVLLNVRFESNVPPVISRFEKALFDAVTARFELKIA